MAYNFQSEEDVKEYLNNLGIEYRFGCYSEKNPEVCHLLGDYLEAVKKEYEKSNVIYKNNCDEFDYGKSCYKYGVYRLLGKGGQKQDAAVAYQYLKKACELGNPSACLSQGLLLISNDENSGIQRDVSKAFSLLEKSCQDNNANACYFLSGMYISGVKKPSVKASPEKEIKQEDYDVPKNMQEAFKLAQKGCELGNVYCCVNLSQMYKKGDGVDKNQELAEKYKNIAKEMQNQLQSDKTLTFQEGLA
ncbi:cytochrome c oxidase assembly factor 7 homolog [Agrilus planipennis]|uniref:Cytochrome c oxidase assembly factor 7 homolog n=1 Tax=Agrilus planipennis TaxID=224129 RepID=A0A1W4WSU1_AGRPL|nr:cytochrome c oxidase assembly factor 7 homolog [Agrilus planipennis]